MVQVTWDETSEQVLNVRSADGPGEYTDDVDTDSLRNLLTGFETVSEERIAAAVMGSYEGELSAKDCQVAANTLPKNENEVTTIAFIELVHQEEKFTNIECSSCGFTPTEGRDLEFEIRERDNWLYEDAICPTCSEVVHVELIRTPEDEDSI